GDLDVEAPAVVPYEQAEEPVPLTQDHLQVRGPGMASDVRDRLLGHPKTGGFHVRRQPSLLKLVLEPGRETRPLRLPLHIPPERRRQPEVVQEGGPELE